MEFPLHWLITFVFFLIFLVMSVGVLIPIAKILQRMGFSAAWCLLYFVPIANLVGLRLPAFGEWPAFARLVRGNPGGSNLPIGIV